MENHLAGPVAWPDVVRVVVRDDGDLGLRSVLGDHDPVFERHQLSLHANLLQVQLDLRNGLVRDADRNWPVKYFSGNLKPFGYPAFASSSLARFTSNLGLSLSASAWVSEPRTRSKKRRTDHRPAPRQLDEPRPIDCVPERLPDPSFFGERRVEGGINRDAHVHVVE